MKLYLAGSPTTGKYERVFHLRRECALSVGTDVQELDEQRAEYFRCYEGVEGICLRCQRAYEKKELQPISPSTVSSVPQGTKVYEGIREVEKLVGPARNQRRVIETNVVTVNGQPLNPRLDIVEHSSTGFEWGFGGSGPAQLALAILADLYDKETALRYYQAFKDRVVSRLRPDKWRITEAEVFAVVLEIEQAMQSAPRVEEPPAPQPTVVCKTHYKQMVKSARKKKSPPPSISSGGKTNAKVSGQRTSVRRRRNVGGGGAQDAQALVQAVGPP